jgi:putative spermidine/putrescine transport system ATP-binding protein
MGLDRADPGHQQKIVETGVIAMAFIELAGVSKSFGKSEVVKKLSLEVEKGEFVSFLGGSGCGKTTTLRMIAGFEEPSAGSVRIDGRDMTSVPPRRRRLGMVFQNYALFPNMDVRANIAFGLRVEGRKRPAVDARVAEMLDLIGMADFSRRYPHQLSGGQQQRVALARAIAPEPEALLLDEPLSALDAKIRLRLRDDIRAIQRKLGMTTIYVTHDQEEALSISDRVAVMREGRIEQIGSPAEIYDHPSTPYVAAFIGTLNSLPCEAVDREAGTVLAGGSLLRTGMALPGGEGAALSLGIRPEAIRVLGPEEAFSPEENRMGGRIESVKFHGSIVRLVVDSGGRRLLVDRFNDPRRALPEAGQAVALAFAAAACIVTKADAPDAASPIEESE